MEFLSALNLVILLRIKKFFENVPYDVTRLNNIQSKMPGRLVNSNLMNGLINPGQLVGMGPGPVGRLFLRSPTLKAGNFAAL